MAKLIHVIVANRGAPGPSVKPIKLETSDKPVEIAPRSSGTAVLTQKQFDALFSDQTKAVRREGGVLRLVDYWAEEDGKRVAVEVKRFGEAKAAVK